MSWEKENYKYLVLLEVDNIKQKEIKEKIRKEYPDEREKFSKTSSAVEISSKE